MNNADYADELNLFHPIINLAQTIIDTTDSLHYMPYIIARLRHGVAKSIYQTEGIVSDGTGDSYAPPHGIEIASTALGLPRELPGVRSIDADAWLAQATDPRARRSLDVRAQGSADASCSTKSPSTWPCTPATRFPKARNNRSAKPGESASTPTPPDAMSISREPIVRSARATNRRTAPLGARPFWPTLISRQPVRIEALKGESGFVLHDGLLHLSVPTARSSQAVPQRR